MVDQKFFGDMILNLMEMPATGFEEGRDASMLFTSESVPGNWEDIIFVRGTGKRDNKPDINWLSSITDRYKLIYSPQDEPWLIDLKNDPNELINQYSNSEYDRVIADMSRAMITYGHTYNDPRVDHPKFKAELEAAINR